MTPARIMIVEDERITAHSLEAQLKKLGHVVVANVARGEDAVVAAERERPDCVLMDIHLAGAMDGIEAGGEILTRWSIPVIYLTAYADDETLARAGKTAPYGYLVKPFEIRGIEAALRMADARREAERALVESEARLNLAMRAARLSDFELDPEAESLRCHRHTPGLAGETEVLEYDFADLLAQVHPDDREQVETTYRTSVSAGGLIDLEFRVAAEAGRRTRWLRVAGKRLGGDRGRVFGVVEDVSERRENQARLAQAARIVEAAAEAIFVADADWKIETANPAYRELIDPDYLPGRLPRILSQQDGERLKAIRAELVRAGFWRGELVFAPVGQVERSFWVSFAQLAAADGAGLIGVLADITGLKAAQAKIETLAYQDALTGLPNRSLAHDRLAQAILRAERGKTPLALLFIDLDHFKAINDSLGHAAGDRVLVEAARRMRGAIRRADTLARLAGDEFLVIAEGGDSPQAALAVADKLLQTLTKPCAVAGHSVACGASIGVAIYPRDGETAETLLRAADHAMYEAKAGGGMRYRLFDPAMFQALLPAWRLETELRRAILHQEFVLHYQAQRDLDGGIVGAEALARWRHPERGLLAPDAFIEQLEKLGLMEAFTEWALRAACVQMAAWRRAGHPVGRVAVNVPPSALQHCALASLIETTLAEQHLPGSCLEVEITESALQTGIEVFACLDRIADAGSAIVLDDFGAGYASLMSLKHLPLVRLKIDREFVRDIEHNAKSAAIVETMLSLAAKLGLDVLAEGVETPAQFAALKRLGCRQFQGFLFDRPVAPEEVAGHDRAA